MIKNSLLPFIIFLLSVPFYGQETIDLMFYNLLEFPSASPANRPQILQQIAAEYDPDIFMVCELETSSGNATVLDVALNGQADLYDAAAFIPNQSGESTLQQNLYFKKDKFELLSQNVIITGIRDINSYILQLKTEDAATNPVQLYVYVSHLKSSQGSANEALRLQAVEALIDGLETIPSDAFVIFAGDFNLYDADEPAYIALLDEANTIAFVDPIDAPGDWNNNEDFSSIHTQSTRISSGDFGAGAGGGLDDRFDFILMSENMVNDENLRYVENTYKAFGNNGNCYNLDINDSSCEGEFSQSLRNNLYSMSDHLPVVMTLATDETFILNTSQFTFKKGLQLEETVITESLRFINHSNTISQSAFTIYNSLGQKVFEDTYINNDQTRFLVGKLETGIYFIRFEDTNLAALKFTKK